MKEQTALVRLTKNCCKVVVVLSKMFTLGQSMSMEVSAGSVLQYLQKSQKIKWILLKWNIAS